MASLNIYKSNNKGFTLVEILVVIGVLIFIIGFGMIIDLNAFKGDTFQTERSTIVSALERARSHAMANMFESPFGVCYNAGNYIIFRNGRVTCLPTASTDETIPANTNIASASDFSNPAKFPTVVFNQLSGNVTGAIIPITVTDGVKSSDITINNEGAINW